jgi:methylmalonyl-CoA/ethylmalonyl-CoA epimerase
MIKRIDHLGIAVTNPEEALAVFAGAMGLIHEETEEIPSQKLRSYHLRVGESCLELLHPTDTTSPVAKFLEKKGPGIHHIALEVDNILTERDRLVARGLQPLTTEPFVGAGGKRVLFFHPKTTGGVLIEICQPGGAEPR